MGPLGSVRNKFPASGDPGSRLLGLGTPVLRLKAGGRVGPPEGNLWSALASPRVGRVLHGGFSLGDPPPFSAFDRWPEH